MFLGTGQHCHKADSWSLGIVAYQTLTGTPAFAQGADGEPSYSLLLL